METPPRVENEVLQREAERVVRDLGVPPSPEILMRFDIEMRAG